VYIINYIYLKETIQT